MASDRFPVPETFLPDAVPVCEPTSRGGMAFSDLPAFQVAWGKHVTIGTTWDGKPAISRSDAARIHAHNVRQDEAREAATLSEQAGLMERARAAIAKRAVAAEARRVAEAEKQARAERSHVNLPRSKPGFVILGEVDEKGRPIVRTPPPDPDVRRPTVGKSRAELQAEQQALVEAIAADPLHAGSDDHR